MARGRNLASERMAAGALLRAINDALSFLVVKSRMVEEVPRAGDEADWEMQVSKWP
jgi:hypothetical protein